MGLRKRKLKKSKRRYPMADQHQKITPFQSGQSTNDKQAKPDKVLIKSKGSEKYHGGTKSPLYHALGGLAPKLPDDMAIEIHTRVSKPSGAHYDPTRSFGEMHSRQAKVPVEGYRPHTSRPGQNAVGSPPNRKGDNPLGRAINRVGSNVLGKPSNKAGAKSGYPRFTPKGGGKNV
jgi:hypothetical protein